MNEFYSEQEQWERLKRWLRLNGPWIVGGVAAGALALAGWRWWEARNERLAMQASERYEQVLEAFDRGDRTRGMTLIDELRRDYRSSPYADQAELLAARVLVESNELPQAAERLARVMQSTRDRELALVARLRLARVQIAQEKPDEALATLDVPDAGAFAPRFQEVRGDAYLAKGDRTAALREYRAARVADAAAVVDTRLLDLKIADLLADGVGSPEAATAAAN